MASAPAPSAFVTVAQRLARERYQFPTEPDPLEAIKTKLDRIIDLLEDSGGGSGIFALTPEAGFPAVVSIPDSTPTVALAANSARQPGSRIQNISDVDILYSFTDPINPADAGILSPGFELRLSDENGVYRGLVSLYQSSGGAKEVWVVSFAS